MQRLNAARSRALRLAGALAAVAVLLTGGPARADWKTPWTSETRALVVDAYEFNPIDWKELTSDKRIVGFINKASDGLAPEWNCSAKSGNEELLCKNRWWKYSVTKELYRTRREMAKTLGLKWGAYHLGRPGNPREQADHFVDFTEPRPDELIALDIEDNTGDWMSLADAEIFANQIFIRTGRYPVLYTNGSTATWISDYAKTYPLLSRLQLWYARYRDDITGLFPERTWPTYALWQFSSMHNCSEKSCPYRVKGAKTDIDVNVSPLGPDALRAAWPFDELLPPVANPAETTLVASLGATISAGLARAVDAVAGGSSHADAATDPEPAPRPNPVPSAPVKHAPFVAAYGPDADRPKPIDPLKLLTATAEAERRAKLAKKTEGETASLPVARPAFALSSKVEGAKDRTLLKPASAADLGPFSRLQGAMGDVARIVRVGPAAAAETPRRILLGELDRSRLRQWLEASESKARADLAGGIGALAIASGRGGRLATALGTASRVGMRGSAERVAEAFQATR